jgi:hypothetical protein
VERRACNPAFTQLFSLREENWDKLCAVFQSENEDCTDLPDYPDCLVEAQAQRPMYHQPSHSDRQQMRLIHACVLLFVSCDNSSYLQNRDLRDFRRVQ